VSSDVSDVEIGTFIAVYVREDGGCYHVHDRQWDEIDAALHNWIERRIDRVLALTTCDGADLLVPASRLAEVTRSTPETRDVSRKRDAAMKAENGFEEP